MESQKYDKIFKEVRSDIQTAIKEGSFAFGKGNEPQIIKIEGRAIETWQSAKGTEIKARLIGIENDSIYLFETANAKIIRATAKQLSKESVISARQAAGLSK